MSYFHEGKKRVSILYYSWYGPNNNNWCNHVQIVTIDESVDDDFKYILS